MDLARRAASTFSGVMGSSVILTPTASSTALAMAGATGEIGFSPMALPWKGPFPVGALLKICSWLPGLHQNPISPCLMGQAMSYSPWPIFQGPGRRMNRAMTTVENAAAPRHRYPTPGNPLAANNMPPRAAPQTPPD